MALYIATGTYTGDGTDNRNITVPTSFAIKFIYIKRSDSASTTSGCAVGSISGMGDGTFLGFENRDLQTNLVQSMGTGTFQVGSGATVNTNAVTYYYLCLGGDDSDIKVGTYTGNSGDNHAITGIGFQPETLIVKGNLNSYAATRFGTSGDSTQFFGDVPNLSDFIQSLDSDGFTLGTQATVNASATTYYYCAIKSVSGQTKVGTYTGNGSDNTNITGVGFQPEMVWIKQGSSSQMLCWTDTAHSADSTSFTNPSTANAANAIQALQSDGFQLGTSGHVNTNSASYYYYAVKNASAPPAGFTPTPMLHMLQMAGGIV